MRLIIATPFLETRGGMERVVLKIAQHFDARIHCMHYDPENTFPEFSELGIEVAKPGILGRLPLGRRVATAMDVGSHFYNLKIDPKEYDLINAHQTPSEWIRNRNSPVVWFCYSPNREAFDLYEWRMKRRSLPSKAVFWASIQAFKYLEYQTVPKIEHIFTSCLNTQARIREYLGRDSEVLHPAVDHRKFSCKAHERFFFYPSRIVPEKDIEYAIEAFRLFRKSGENDWKLVIAGSLSNRPEHIAYFKKLKSLCDESIIIETNVSDERLIELYAACYAVLYTPVNEDYGLVPLEAMASSKPCISRNEGGPRETVIDGTDGFLVNSPLETAQRMGLLSRDPEKCIYMGKAGRKKVETKFTWERFLKRFGEKADELLNQKAAGTAPGKA